MKRLRVPPEYLEQTLSEVFQEIEGRANLAKDYTAMECADFTLRRMRTHAPVVFGTLRRSIGEQFSFGKPVSHASVFPRVKYAPVLEWGVGPHVLRPPYRPGSGLWRWVRRKFRIRVPARITRVAKAVSEGIWERGTPKDPSGKQVVPKRFAWKAYQDLLGRIPQIAIRAVRRAFRE